MKNLKYLLLISLLAVLILPNFSSAMTVEELTAKIKELNRQIEELKVQLVQLQAQPTEWCHNFNQNLKIENSGEEVAALHIALGKEGFNIIEEEKSKQEFGESTASAISGFQQKYIDEILTPWGLKYGTGFVGKTTREKLNKLYGCGVEKTTPTPSSTIEKGETLPTPIIEKEKTISITPISFGKIIQLVAGGITNISDTTIGGVTTPTKPVGGGGPCVVTVDGLVFCWNGLTVTQVAGLTDIASIAPGDPDSASSHSCALKTDGSALCWGSNYYGQLGDGTFINRQAPTSVSGLGSGTTAVIAIGSRHTCALKKDGSVVCWGDNNHGQIGDGTLEGRLVPTQVFGLSPGTVANIFSDNGAVGAGGTCALKTNGAIVCWGENFLTGFDAKTAPVQISSLTPGTIKSLNGFGFKTSCPLKTDGSVVCSGTNYCGQSGNNQGKNAFTMAPGTTVAISTGWYHSCALKKDGSVVCWGCNEDGKVGDGTVTNRYVPVQVIGLGAGTTAAISVRGYNSCALKTDGSIVCWPGTGEDGKPTRTPTLMPGLTGQ